MGIWQLGRAQEKELALTLHAQQLAQPVGGWSTLTPKANRYHMVQLKGQYLSGNHWLLDNQIHKGRFGYTVYTPFCGESRCILVDRGWIKGDLDRNQLPVIDHVAGTVILAGRIDKISLNPAIGENEPLVSSPYRVQQIDLKLVSDKLAGSRALLGTVDSVGSLANTGQQRTGVGILSPWILRLNDQQPGKYEAHWQPVVIGPEKHYGYAVQWFAMAAALLTLMFYIQIKHSKDAEA